MYKHYMKFQPFDAIIVPGYPYDGEKWDDIMKMRVLWAKYLIENNRATNIIFSGSAVYSPYIESLIMREYAIAIGIDSNIIFTEQKAEHSTENVFYSYQFAQEKGWENVALATDYVQIKMVRSFISKENIPVAYLPALFDVIDSMDVYRDSLPNPQIIDSIAFVSNFVSLTDRKNPYQRWRGTRGRNISKKDKKKERKKD
ncbi:MAG: YdcF family protein [Bacteroidales bacterium]|nr:YdcF family protein [Bacteroidales bacterium]